MLVASGCGGGGPARHVVLVSLDTLRADMLGCYGYPRPTSPSLDALAADGVLLRDVVATSPWTLPSHGSLLTGLYPSRHGLRSPWKTMSEDVGSWAQVLAARGFETAAIVNSFYLGRRFGLDRGFATLSQLERPPSRARPSGVTDLALRWLSERDGSRRFFLFLHYYDVHSDYAALPRHVERFDRGSGANVEGTTAELLAFRRGELELSEADAARLIDRYAAEIHQVDAAIGRLRRALDALGLAAETVLIVVSDHGEEFLEHGGVMHGATHFQEVMHVPWLLAGPGVPAGRRVAEPVSLVDVMPTALSLLGVEVPAGLDGVDISPLFGDAPDPSLRDRLLFAETAFGGAWNDSLRSVRQGPYKLVTGETSGRRALYDLSQDPDEEIDASSRLGEVSERLGRELRGRSGVPRLPEAGRDVELDPGERERLRALGYAP